MDLKEIQTNLTRYLPTRKLHHRRFQKQSHLYPTLQIEAIFRDFPSNVVVYVLETG